MMGFLPRQSSILANDSSINCEDYKTLREIYWWTFKPNLTIQKKKKKKKIKCRTFSCKNLNAKPELHPNIYISNGLKEESMTEQGKKIWWFYNKFKFERKKKERVVPCLQTLIGWVSLAHWCPHIYGTYMCNTTMKKAWERERERVN